MKTKEKMLVARSVSVLMLIAAAGMIEGATNFKGLILPAIMVVLFGYIALCD